LHEWALAEAVVEALRSLLERGELAEIHRVVVKVGELQQVEEEVFTFAIKELLKLSGLEGVKVELVRERVLLRCRSCGYEWSPDLESLGLREKEAVHFLPELIHSFASCPRCGSFDFDIVRGRGVWVWRVEGRRA